MLLLSTHHSHKEAIKNTKRKSKATEAGYHTGREAPNKGQRFPAEVLTPDEVRSLILVCSSRAPTGIRNRALLATLYRGGLRLSEALALYPKDLDPDRGTVTVLHGKGDKRRTIGLDPEAFAIIQRWSDRRAECGLSARRPLFCTLAGAPLNGSYVRTLMPRLAKRAGIEKRVHPHGLRHTHAFELAEEGVSLPVIQAQLGHTSLVTTERYLRHVAPKLVIDTMRARDWQL